MFCKTLLRKYEKTQQYKYPVLYINLEREVIIMADDKIYVIKEQGSLGLFCDAVSEDDQKTIEQNFEDTKKDNDNE